MNRYEWKVIPSYPNYEVSSIGTVRRLDSKRMLIISINGRAGYEQVWIDGGSKPCHILVAEAFIGPRPKGYVIDHIDENKQNNRPINLRYVTSSYNIGKPWKPKQKIKVSLSEVITNICKRKIVQNLNELGGKKDETK